MCCSKGWKEEDSVGEMHIDGIQLASKEWTELKLARVVTNDEPRSGERMTGKED